MAVSRSVAVERTGCAITVGIVVLLLACLFWASPSPSSPVDSGSITAEHRGPIPPVRRLSSSGALVASATTERPSLVDDSATASSRRESLPPLPIVTSSPRTLFRAGPAVYSAAAFETKWFDVALVRRCNRTRAFSPTIAEQIEFYRSHPAYGRFERHYDKMKHALREVETAFPESVRTKWAAELVDLVQELLAMPRPNPGITATDPRWGRRVVPVHTTHGILSCAELFGPKGVRWPVPAACGGASWRFFHYAMERHFYYIFEQLQRGPAAAVFRDRAGFTPRLFLDLGARDHDRRTRRRTMDQLPAVSHESGSIAWMIKHYPGFDDIPTLAFEIDPKYAPSYRVEYKRRKDARAAGKRVAPFRLHTGAAWVHSEGIGLQMSSDMINVNDGCTQGAGCRCVPTVDITELLREMPDRSVTMKIDIEHFEWVVLAEWAKAGVLNRIGEMFLECHTTSLLTPEQRVFRDLEYGRDSGHTLWSLFVGPMDCIFLHDFVRSYGVATHPWP